MKHPLRVGQVFKCHKFKDLLGTVVTEDNKLPYVDFENLKFDIVSTTHVRQTETKPGGWKRERDLELDRRPACSYENREFEVVEVKLTGGGSAHGPHDTYPDGHWVHAVEVTSGERPRHVRFYQTGCFIGMVEPKDIQLIRGPKDKLCKWTKKYEESYE